ncbi:hypothetical protein [Streptosporangium carneum]|uniref:hypothetical protein n=1 Tax=Streptosporangium carneum TaxID=47481 RepID=UPI0022F2B8CE|nr:hypothetical protein [Streptosporangium carneum]
MKEHPPWHGPPDDLLGATVGVEQTVFRSETLVIELASAVAFPENVKFHLRMAARHVEGVNDVWWRRRDLMFGGLHHWGNPDRPLEDETIRFGVRFPDGSKGTTLEEKLDFDDWPPPRPTGPVLRHRGGGGGGGTNSFISGHWDLWLWPLPPPEPFEFAVEWPAFGVPLTFVEIDGTEIAAAAGRARPYWP